MRRTRRQYFIGSDEDSHYYIVDSQFRNKFYEWVDFINNSNCNNFVLPQYAKQIDGPVRNVEFYLN